MDLYKYNVYPLVYIIFIYLEKKFEVKYLFSGIINQKCLVQILRYSKFEPYY